MTHTQSRDEEKNRRVANNENYDAEFGPNDQRRFWKKVEKSDGCWNWTGARTPIGYGDFGLNGKTVRAHRLMYHKYVAPIPENMVVDHMCRNASCVNPDHLRVITHVENTMIGNSPQALNARKTHCKRGHEFTKENTDIRGAPGINRGRHCLACQKAYQKIRSKNVSDKRREAKNVEIERLNSEIAKLRELLERAKKIVLYHDSHDLYGEPAKWLEDYAALTKGEKE